VAVLLVLESRHLDRSVFSPLVEIRPFLVGRVTGGDHEAVPVRGPVELSDPFIEVSELSSISAAFEVERPDLLFLVPVLFRFVLVGLVARALER
jgi:hypothetical protein